MTRGVILILGLALWGAMLLPAQESANDRKATDVPALPILRLHCDKTDLLTAETAFMLLEIFNPTSEALYIPSPFFENPYNSWYRVDFIVPGKKVKHWPKGNCGMYEDPGYGMVVHPGQRRFHLMNVGPYHDIPESGPMMVQVRAEWFAYESARDIERVFGPEKNFEVLPRTFSPLERVVVSNPVEVNYRPPSTQVDIGALDQMKRNARESRASSAGRWASASHDFALDPMGDESTPSDTYRISGRFWLSLYDEKWSWDRYRIDPTLDSFDRFLRSVASLRLLHVEDNFLFEVAMATRARKPGFSLAVLRHLSTQYATRDHGIRAAALLGDIEKGRFVPFR